MSVLGKAIEYVMREPDVKSIHRTNMEDKFFTDNGLRFMSDGCGSKTLILDIIDTNNDWWCGSAWLKLILEHIGEGTLYVITHQRGDGSGCVRYSFTDESVDQAISVVREKHTMWTIGKNYVFHVDDIIDYDGFMIPETELVTADSVSACGEFATCDGVILPRCLLLDGTVVPA